MTILTSLKFQMLIFPLGFLIFLVHKCINLIFFSKPTNQSSTYYVAHMGLLKQKKILNPDKVSILSQSLLLIKESFMMNLKPQRNLTFECDMTNVIITGNKEKKILLTDKFPSCILRFCLFSSVISWEAYRQVEVLGRTGYRMNLCF